MNVATIIERLRNGLARRMDFHQSVKEDEAERLMEDAADMLEFFFGQLQMHSPKMTGQHSYRFKSGGWPMTHCIGPNAEEAVLNAISEIKKHKNG